MTGFGNKIKTWMEKQNLTQAVAAKKMGIHQSGFSRLLKSDNPQLKTIYLFHNKLGIPFEYFYRR